MKTLARLLCGGLSVGSTLILSAAASGQPSYGYDFLTIGSPNNAPYQTDNLESLTNGRGSVAYEYRISRTEVTSQQWMEFINTYSGELGDPYHFSLASGGFMPDSSYSGPGSRWTLISPSLANAPVFGISWRQAAMYMNWLHNDKQPTLAALQTGAYDTSTFGDLPGGQFTDAATHLPGAKYWIPTLDEWIKAAHYDPNRYGEGQGGYWQSVNSTDDPLIAGLPGVGQTSAGLEINDPLLGERDIPLGAYADQMSPWGLLDLSGGASEWTEETYYPFFPNFGRGLEGQPAGLIFPFSQNTDLIDYLGIEGPSNHPRSSFRIATAVPLPGSFLVVAGWASLIWTPKRRAKQ